MDVLMSIFIILMRLLHFFIAPFLTKKSNEKIQPPKDNLLFKSATELSRLIRERKISSREVIEVYIKRINEVNKFINAVVENRFEKALNEAKNVDDYLSTTKDTLEKIEQEKPLLGVPVTVKESCKLSGMSFTVGNLQRIGILAEENGEAVSKLIDSGAIPILVSNTPELCLSWETRNLVTGPTKNPHELSRTSGASSGGEGALLGAGASVIGVGSDIAGSIRFPAMCCGVFGHKPTSRIISIKGHYPIGDYDQYSEYLVVGPMTRYSIDLRLMTKIMSDSKILPSLNLDEKVDLSKLTVYYMLDAGSSIIMPSVDNEIKNAIKLSVEHLEDRCKSNIDHNFKFQNMLDALTSGLSILSRLEPLPNLLKGTDYNLFTETFKTFFDKSTFSFEYLLGLIILHAGNNLLSKDYIKLNQRMKQIFVEKLGKDGIFLYPTFNQCAFKHKELVFTLNGLGYLTIFNTLGLPATNVPCGKNKEGLPIGIQVVAGPYQDRLCFAVAEELEKRFGGWKLS